MPFKSKKQMRWMFANDPEMAKRWAKHTEDIKALPEKTKPKKEEVKEALADLERNLFNDVINLALAKQAAGIPVAPRPLPAKKPVTANQPNAVSSITGSLQYGANLKQNVQNTASQLAPAQQTKMGFLAKLAQGPEVPPAALPPTAVATTPPPAAVPAPAEPAAQPASPPPVPLGRSNWTKGVSTGTGNFSLPANVKSRVHSQSPEDHAKATALWNLRKFAPIEQRYKMEGKEAITSQDIADMHAHNQKRFMNFVASDPSRQQAFAQNQPDMLDVMSGKTGTPQQRAAVESYLNDLDQRMVDIGKRNIEMARLRGDTQEQQTTVGAIDEADKGLKNVFGTNTRELYTGDVSPLDIATSPAATLATGRVAGIPGMALSFLRPDQYANVAANAVRPWTSDTFAKGVRDYTDAGVSSYYGLSGLASAGKSLGAGGWFNRGLAAPYHAVSGIASGAMAADAYKTAPSLGEMYRGAPGPGYTLPVDKADLASEVFTPSQANGMPRSSDLSQDLKSVQVGTDAAGNPIVQDVPAYSVAGKFNLGSAGQALAKSNIDNRIAGLSSLPADQQKAEMAKINQELVASTGATYQEYTAYKTSSDSVTKARQSYDAIQKQVQQDPERADLASQYAKAEADFVFAQKEAARVATPFLTKVMDRRYETEIKPMEANISQMSGQIDAVMNKIRNNQPVTAEDVAIVQQGKQYMSTAKDFAFEKAKLAFMRDGNLASPGIDKIFAEDGQKGFEKLSALFTGTSSPLIDSQTGQPLMVKMTDASGVVKTVPLTRNTNVLESLAKKEFDEQVAKATGLPVENMQVSTEVAKGPTPVNDVTGQAAGDQPEAQGFMGQMSQLWEGLNGTEKMLIMGGLSLGAVGILSSLFGGSDDDDDEEGSSLPTILGILGIGAVAAVPLMRYFGVNQPSAPQAQDNSIEAVKSRQGMAAIQEAAKTDPAKAAKMVAAQATSNPETMKSFQELDSHYKNGWKSYGFDVTPERIAGKSNGKLNAEQARMLKDNWPLVRKELGFN